MTLRAVSFRISYALSLTAALFGVFAEPIPGRSLACATEKEKEQTKAEISTSKPKSTSSNSLSSPLFAKPIPAARTELPTAFSKAVPASIADLRVMQEHVRTLLARVSPAVVAVEVGEGSGSGVIISPEGLVMTAGHVGGEPDHQVRFTFPDGKTARGKTLGSDLDLDSGLMQITDRGPW